MTLFGRRQLLLVVAATACNRTKSRCGYCGMPIDPKSPWNTELALEGGGTSTFDSPRCAFMAWRTGQARATEIFVQDYYDRVRRPGTDVSFVTSSDVVGPMGPDLVPVDRARAQQFAREHTGTRPLSEAEVTLELLKELH